jgi:hypothetical protein
MNPTPHPFGSLISRRHALKCVAATAMGSALHAGVAVAAEDLRAEALARSFRGRLNDVSWAASSPPVADEVDLVAMAKAALNYLRGNPDATRAYECRFSLGPLGIPCLVPLLPSSAAAVDPISLADTDCRMDWQFPHMRAMAGEPAACDVEKGVRRRIAGYPRRDGLMWVNPAAWTGPEEAVTEEWATTWGSAKLLFSLSETYERTRDPADAQQAREILLALKQIARWDGAKAFYPGGGTPWRGGQWLKRGWARTHYHNYPFVVEPAVRYYECTGDREGLDLAIAFADGFLAGSQPDMGEQQIDPKTGAFKQHVHIHTHAVWGVAHLGAVLRESRYLEWARRAYDFVLAQGTDFGWYPEFIPQGEYRTEICVVGDMTSIAAWLARGGQPGLWDNVERTVRNELRRSQFSLTPAFVKLFREVHRDRPADEVRQALDELKRLEGGFVAQASFDDWVSYPGSPKLGSPGLNANGVHMMGCCPPEGMRALWEAWNGVVETTAASVQVNLCLTRDHPAVRVQACRPECGRLEVTAKQFGSYLLRPPAWANHESVQLVRNGKPCPMAWSGPGNAYVLCPEVRPGDALVLMWPVPRFTQTFVPQSIPDRKAPLTVRWVGNEVVGVEPRGKHLPMFGPLG